MEDKKAIRISKTISYALRHNPSAFGLTLAQDGSVPVEDLLAGLSKALGRPITHSDLDEVMSLPGKRRLVIEGGRIRAYYGHSIKEEVVRPQTEPPEVLFHATSHKALPLPGRGPQADEPSACTPVIVEGDCPRGGKATGSGSSPPPDQGP